jgi:hypothetical protein
MAFADPAASPDVSFASVSQTYHCKIGTIITQNVTATVSGKAAIVTSKTNVKTVHLSAVVFKFTNSFGTTATISNVKMSVPDPNVTSAPYIANSAHAGTTPAGWTAGHDSTGAYLFFAGSATIANGATESSAALRATYKDKGPAGTAIAFHPGAISFMVTAPVSDPATCTATAPIKTIASVTE